MPLNEYDRLKQAMGAISQEVNQLQAQVAQAEQESAKVKSKLSESIEERKQLFQKLVS